MTAPPAPLRFGVATSAFQVEGAVDVDGRGPSIWDTFCALPGTVLDGSDGAVACDHYHRVDEDLDLIASAALSSYRFSIAWPRIQPDGRTVEPRGLAFYDRLVDGCLARGLQPFPTLYHWDLPQAIQDRGGWPARETAQRFADYTTVVAERLGDRVATWATHNEPWCTAFLGHASATFAPGQRDAGFPAAHHTLLSHALSTQALRAAVPGAEVGIVLNLTLVHGEPDADPRAVDVVDAIQNRMWLDALLDGRYPDVLPELADRALVQAGDLEAIGSGLDWLGINYYTPFRVGSPQTTGDGVGQDSDAFPGAPNFGFHPRGAVTTMGWEVDPTGLEDLLVQLSERAPSLPLRVTENGSAYADEVRAEDGSVDDADRESYLLSHVAATLRARDRGADVRDYLAWSLMDNFEWAQGYTQKFGIVEIEPQTLRRIPKRSFRALAEIARTAAS